MKKKTLQAKLALVLSASMVLTMLAPAMPARAADVAGGTVAGAGDLIFDFSELTPSIKGFVPNIKFNGAVGSSIANGLGSSSGLHINGNLVYMPYLNDTGVFDSGRVVDNKTWIQRGLKGYTADIGLNGSPWYNAKANGFDMKRLDVISFQPTGTTYYMKLKPDGTNFSHIVNHEPAASATYVPSLPAPGTAVPTPVMQAFQAVPKNIPGYKVMNTGLEANGEGGATLTFDDGLAVNKTDFKYDTRANYVTGTTINRGFTVTYKYAVDNTKNFDIKVKDNIFANSAAVASYIADPISGTQPISSQSRPTKSFNVLQALPTSPSDTNAVVPNATLTTIRPGDAHSRYILDAANPVTISYAKGTPDPVNGSFTSDVLIPAADTAGYSKLHTDAAHTLIGQMPNQNVTVTYNYINNPNFYTTLKVKYVDAVGNDIGEKVAQAAGITATAPSTPGAFYKVAVGNDTFLEVRASGTSTYSVPAPELATYQSGPRIEAENPITWGDSFEPDNLGTLPPANAGNPKFDVTADNPSTSETLIVTYTQDPSSITNVNVSSTAGGKLMVGTDEYDIGAHPSHQKTLARTNVTGSNYQVVVNDTDLPTPTPDIGYEFVTWEHNGNPVTLPYTATLNSTDNEILLNAKFAPNPSDWNTYNFAAGSPEVQIINSPNTTVVNKDASGNLRTILFSDLNEFTNNTTGISVNAGFDAIWYDENMNQMQPGTDISQMSGKTFTVYAVPNTPAATYTPAATSSLNPSTGEPTIAIDPASPAPLDSRLQYVVTDNAGNVVGVIPGGDLIRNGANITGPFLTPGETYHVHSALPTAGAMVGAPLPTTDISAPSTVTIPVALTPQVAEDPANRGRASITINPTSPNTEYALVDDMGNEVYPFTSPTGRSHTFGNLDPDRIYHVVPRPVGSNDSITDRQNAGADLPVNTGNLGLSVHAFDVTIIANNAPMPSNFKVNGVATTDINELRGLAPGTSVEIVAAPLDNNSNVFKEWQGITGVTSTVTTSRITFTMPNGPVKLQVVYDDGTNWGTQFTDHTGSGKSIRAQYPVLSEAGDFRVVIEKKSMTNDVKNLIAGTLVDEYKPVFMMNILVQKKNPVTNLWEDYVPTSGEVQLDTSVETGALMSTRDYMLHEIATGSNAVSQLSGDFENPSSGYTGTFDVTLTSGRTYAFGYITPAVFRIKIRDNRDNQLITDLVLLSTETVQDKANLYSHAITGDYIENDGVTWHYEGLSQDRNNYVEFDPALRVTQDATIYVYYSNDRVQRAEKERELNAAVAAAKSRMSDYTSASQNQLRAQIQAAQAVLDRLNRKSTTAELQAALDALNALYSTLTLKSGGSSGSGGGGGTTGRKAGTKTSTGLVVGVDGNWQLIDENQHHWIFVMKNGARVNGWNKLTYTYEGQTRSDWYYFNSDGVMRDGWFYDVDSASWYYLNENHDGFFGHMTRGWHHDRGDQKWYYMDPASGVMRTGWNNLSGEWYYLNPTAPAQTYFYDDVQKKWLYNTNSTTRPLGSMYENEATPDGYNVNASGAWVR